MPSFMPWILSYLGHSRKRQVTHIADALHAINERVSADYDPMLHAIGYADKVHDKGCIRVYDSYKSFKKNALEWRIRKQHGQDYELLGENDLRRMAPAIGKVKQFGVFQPQWRIMDDPKGLVGCLRHWLLAQGVTMVNANVDALVCAQSSVVGVTTSLGVINADMTIVAAGAWSKALAKQVGEPCLLESERGYNTTLPNPNISLKHELLFAEEMFVVSPLAIGLRVGGHQNLPALRRRPIINEVTICYV